MLPRSSLTKKLNNTLIKGDLRLLFGFLLSHIFTSYFPFSCHMASPFVALLMPFLTKRENPVFQKGTHMGDQREKKGGQRQAKGGLHLYGWTGRIRRVWQCNRWTILPFIILDVFHLSASYCGRTKLELPDVPRLFTLGTGTVAVRWSSGTKETRNIYVVKLRPAYRAMLLVYLLHYHLPPKPMFPILGHLITK
jgi:hypothetical protein